MLKKIIIDCDNTFGVKDCDVDDGLAIIYALGCENCEVLGITTTFGNNSIDVVYPNTVHFMKNLKRDDIPVLKGSANDAGENEAAKFLLEMSNRYPNDLYIISLGSLTNLYHAWLLDNSFYDRIAQISSMGGITEPLIINGKILNELNFSCNYKASHHVLTQGKSIMISTANTCLLGFFSHENFKKYGSEDAFTDWIYQQSLYWLERENKVFNQKGMYKWDVHAAAALLNPQLFHMEVYQFKPDEGSLKTGFLMGNGETKEYIVPKIIDQAEYEKHVYNTYKNFNKV